MSVVDVEALGQELSPEEIEAEDGQVEAKEIDNVNSPFAHMLNNLVSGGGRQGKRVEGATFNNFPVSNSTNFFPRSQRGRPRHPNCGGRVPVRAELRGAPRSLSRGGGAIHRPGVPAGRPVPVLLTGDIPAKLSSASTYFYFVHFQDPPFAFEWKRASELSSEPKLFEAGTVV